MATKKKGKRVTIDETKLMFGFKPNKLKKTKSKKRK